MSTDSLQFYHQKVDSLLKLTSSLQDKKINFKLGEAAVQAAIILAIVTLITVLLGFIFKDYLIPNWIAKRTSRKNGEEIFIKYRLHLFWAAFNFNNRISEISRTRSHYLWKNTSLNVFYDYKYKSSVYRLCTLLGWIRAFRLSESAMTIKNSKNYLVKISRCITTLESALADGQRIEMSMAKGLCSIAQINVGQVDEDLLSEFSIEVDHILHNYLHLYQLEYVADLSDDLQNQLVEEVDKKMKDFQTKANLPTRSITLKDNKALVIKELSVKLALIYRDWQQAIGDMMIRKEENNLVVKSFKTFEEYWDQENTTEKKWLVRAERIFSNLNMKVDRKSDSRIEQLEIIYACVYKLLKILGESKLGTKLSSEQAFKSMRKELKSSLAN